MIIPGGDCILHNISPAIIDHDITIFLEHDLGLLGQARSLGARWPGKARLVKLNFSALSSELLTGPVFFRIQGIPPKDPHVSRNSE